MYLLDLQRLSDLAQELVQQRSACCKRPCDLSGKESRKTEARLQPVCADVSRCDVERRLASMALMASVAFCACTSDSCNLEKTLPWIASDGRLISVKMMQVNGNKNALFSVPMRASNSKIHNKTHVVKLFWGKITAMIDE